MIKYGFLILASFGLASCSGGDAPVSGNTVEGNVYQLAVAGEGRNDTDRARDPMRKPAEILEFFHIEPGMTVLDMFSGGGYYTEILSNLVGDEGTVYAHNNQGYLSYAGDEIEQRYANDRLNGVIRLNVEVENVELPPNSLDAALLVLSYHDLYFRPGDGSWPDIDGPEMLGDIYRALRPGGMLGVVDHRAPDGSDKIPTATTLHRIEERVVLCEIERAGFAYDGSSDLLSNPDDDLSVPMYADSIKGQTSRFVIRFHKPIDGSEEEGASGLCD